MVREAGKVMECISLVREAGKVIECTMVYLREAQESSWSTPV